MGPGDFQMFMYLPSFSLAITLTWLNNPCALYFPSKASICQTGFRQQYRVVSTEGLLFMRGCSAYMHACLRTHTKSRPHFFRFLLNKAFGNSAHLHLICKSTWEWTVCNVLEKLWGRKRNAYIHSTKLVALQIRRSGCVTFSSSCQTYKTHNVLCATLTYFNSLLITQPKDMDR